MGTYARRPRCRAEIALGWQEDFAAAIRTLQDGLAGQLLAKRGRTPGSNPPYRWRLLVGSARNLLQSAGRPRTRTRSFCGGAPTTIISGFLGFEALSLKPITPLLPGLILIKADQARTLALHTTLQLLATEMAEPSHSRSYCVGWRELPSWMAPHDLRSTDWCCTEVDSRKCKTELGRSSHWPRLRGCPVPYLPCGLKNCSAKRHSNT
jgi:hypothetical protein